MATTEQIQRFGWRRVGGPALALAVAALVQVGQVAPAGAAQSTASVLLAAHVGTRAVVQPDRSVVTVAPGESVTVAVTVKTRMGASEALAVALNPGLPREAVSADGGALVTYRWADRTGPLAGETLLGTVTRSGVHVVPLTLTLAATARGPVTLPLAFRTGITGPTLAAASTRVQP